MESTRPIRVLVVDDDAGIRDLLETVLQNDGYDVTCIDDPAKAEGVVKGAGFQLALLDVMMPGQDGIETLRRLRQVDDQLAVVMITGYPSVETAVESMKLDAMDYVRKPFTVEALRAVIRRVLDRKGLGRSPEERMHREIGARLRRARQERGLTLKQLASRTGLSLSQISQIERADSSASLSSLYRLAAALDVRMRDLFGEF